VVEDDKRVLCQLLGKLHIPDKVDDYKLRCLKVLMHNLNSVSF
jgi:condensin complex subunit 3